MKSIPEAEQSKAVKNSTLSTSTNERVLGVSWSVEKEFFFEVKLPNVSATKRGILSVTNSLYDPLGFVLPVVLRARILYSEVCQEKLQWDHPLSLNLLAKWGKWLKDLDHL